MAVDLANAMESADKQANVLRQEPTPSSVNKVDDYKHRATRRNNEPRKSNKDNNPCFRCGENHPPQSCVSKIRIAGSARNKAISKKFPKRKRRVPKQAMTTASQYGMLTMSETRPI